MPSILKSRVAIAVLAGVFLIPIATSTLRGLTHVLTCSDAVATPFVVVIEPGSDPIVLSAAQLTPDGAGSLCGGLDVTLQAHGVDEDHVALTILLANDTAQAWRGTIDLSLAGTRIPITIGRVDAAETRSETVTLGLGTGESEITGSLLIGP